jgi:hypothetical protein
MKTEETETHIILHSDGRHKGESLDKGNFYHKTSRQQLLSQDSEHHGDQRLEVTCTIKHPRIVFL